jgi:two-component system, chemotaxis family, protein-glutamate methylesterase/glutaminase
MRNTRVLEAGDRVRVLVVDDSVVVRRAITMALEADPEIDVVGVASSGELALQKVDQLNPDVVTLDVEMPGMNGLDTLSELRRRRPDLRVVMLSTLTQGGAEVTMEALSRGADDCASKSSGGLSIEQSVAQLREQLGGKVKQFFRFRPKAAPVGAPVAAPVVRPGGRPAPTANIEAIVLGISTGGPTALATLLPALGNQLQLPLLIVQHMPPMFTKMLAQRLDSQSQLKVVEAEAGMLVSGGTVYIAPGDFHMKLKQTGAGVEIVLDQGPPENCCRPAVDVLFRSAAEVWGKHAAAVVMTGMGADGLAGARSLWAAGATVIAQDEATSVVWGMPGELVRAQIADQVLPLDQIAPALVQINRRTRG